MKKAPKSIQESYREFVKIKKYLEDLEKNPNEPKKTTQLTPGKIFLGGRRRLHLQRSDKSYVTATPVKLLRGRNHTNTPDQRLSVAFASRRSRSPTAQASKFTLGHRSSSNSQDSSPRGRGGPGPSTSSGGFLFQKLFTVAGDKQVTGSNNTTDDDDNNTMKPRFSNQNKESILLEEPVSTYESEPVRADLESSRLDKNQQLQEGSTVKDEETNQAGILNHKNMVSVSKSPRVKSRQLARSSKSLDSGWLARLNAEDYMDEHDENNESERMVNQTPVKTVSPGSEELFAGLTSEENMDNFDDNDDCKRIKISSPGKTFPHSPKECLTRLPSEENMDVDEVKDEFERIRKSIMDAAFSSEPEDCLVGLNPEKNMDDDDDNGNDDCESSRKRTSDKALSPSPEKPKRKFFKSSAGERKLVTYSLRSYKPPSPQKKSKGSKTETTALPMPHSSSSRTLSEAAKNSRAESNSGFKTAAVRANQGESEATTTHKVIESTLDASKTNNRRTTITTTKTGSKPNTKKRCPGSTAKKLISDDDDQEIDKGMTSAKKSTVIDVFDEGPFESMMTTKKVGKRPVGLNKRRQESLQR